LHSSYMTHERTGHHEESERERAVREKCPKWLSVQVTRGGETPLHVRHAVIHARHARVALVRDSYEAKRREQYA